MVQDPINLGFDDPSSLGVPPAFRPIKALKKAGCAVNAAAEMQRLAASTTSARSSDARIIVNVVN